MTKRMTVVLPEDVYNDLKMVATRCHLTYSEIIVAAIRERLDRLEDAALLPAIDAAHSEYAKKGGRPWHKLDWKA